MKRFLGKAWLVVFLVLCLVSFVCGLQDAYITIDGKGVGVCLAVDDPDNMVCNVSESLVLDGTRDHNIYFLNDVGIRQNTTLLQKLSYLIVTPAKMLNNSFLFIGAVIVCVCCAYFVLRIANIK